MDSKSIIRILLKNKVAVIIILSVATACAVIFSSKSFIKPLYKSITTLYPTTTYSVSKAIMNTNGLIYVDPLEIGEEAQTDQMMQILNSGLIRDKIIGWGIDCGYMYKDYNIMLDEHDSPIDKGRDTFEYLIKESRIK